MNTIEKVKELSDLIIGISVDEASALIAPDYYIRVSVEDGVSHVVTRDFDPKRVNVIVKNKIITYITSIS